MNDFLLNLPIRKKLFIFILPLLIALIGFAGFIIYDEYKKINEYRISETYLNLAQNVSEVIHELQRESKLNYAYIISTHPHLKNQILEQNSTTDLYIETLSEKLKQSVLKRVDPLVSKELRQFQRALLDLSDMRNSVLWEMSEPDENLNYYNTLIGFLAESIKQSALLEVNDHIFTDMIGIRDYLEYKIFSGIESVYISHITLTNSLTPDLEKKLIENDAYQTIALDNFLHDYIGEKKKKVIHLLKDESILEGNVIRKTILNRADKEKIGIDYKDWNTLQNERINTQQTIFLSLLNELKSKINTQVNGLIWQFGLNVFTILFLFLFLALFSRFLIRMITKSVHELHDASEALMEGRYDYNIQHLSEDELGKIGQKFNELFYSFRVMTEAFQTVSEGDLDIEFQIRGENDVLGKALKQMLTTLKAIYTQFIHISDGMIEREYTAQGEQDIFGKSVVSMVDALIEIQNVTTAISVGKFDTQIKIKGQKDVIGNALDSMQRSLQQLSVKARRISQGDFDITIELLSDEDELGKSLRDMIIFLKEVVEALLKVSNGDYSIRLQEKSEYDLLSRSLNSTIKNLDEVTKTNDEQLWLINGKSKIASVVRGELDRVELCQDILKFLCQYLQIDVGTFYLFKQHSLKRVASFAFHERKGVPDTYNLSEGLVGQTALEKAPIILREVPEDYMTISSGLGKSAPNWILSFPITMEDNSVAVLEFAGIGEFKENAIDFLNEVNDTVAISLREAESRESMSALVKEMEVQQSKLKESELKTRTILETAIDSIITLNMSGIIQTINTATSEIFGYTSDELLGKHITLLMNPEDKGENSLENYLKPGKSQVLGKGKEFKGLHKSGRVFPIYLSVSEIKHGDTHLFASIIRDITEQKKAEEALKQNAQQMQEQAEELRVINEELEEQTQMLKDSEQKLKVQKEELRVTNEELVRSSEELKKRQKEIEEKNTELIEASRVAEEKAEQVERSSQYKSEFLANMSHELRTPLNSILLLSDLLKKNKEQNLNTKQIEFAEAINKSGSDLLNLINDILDLSKVESGKFNLHYETIPVADIIQSMKRNFLHPIEDKGLQFKISVAESVPEKLFTDQQRLEQIIKNFISNALKFTEKGYIELSISVLENDQTINNRSFYATKALRFNVADTGVGIAKEKQHLVFEAFQQEDGSTSRKYGGTGLGLTISTHFAGLFGGTITLESTQGVGSTFSLIIPLKDVDLPQSVTEKKEPIRIESVKEQKDIPTTSETKTILIIEENIEYADKLLTIAKDAGYKTFHCTQPSDALAIAKRIKPFAILCDTMFHGKNEWKLLKQFKEDKETAHIPIHILSDEHKENKVGADSVQEKPVAVEEILGVFKELFPEKTNINENKILIVEDDKTLQLTLKAIFEERLYHVDLAYDGDSALSLLQKNTYNCIILDLGLPDMTGQEMYSKLKQLNVRIPPVVIHTGQLLEPEEMKKINDITQCVVVKGTRSVDRLVTDVRSMIEQSENSHLMRKSPTVIETNKTSMVNRDDVRGKKVLLTDDDARNVFALTHLLEANEIQVIKAFNGHEAIAQLQSDTDIDVILMDIMMPEMDGYEAIKRIRELSDWKETPIIALTAKAMTGDKEKCIQAGANDYISKPIDPDKLINTLKLWMNKKNK